MSEESLLKGKQILIVDDEPDVLDTLEELLPMCDVIKASTFEQAKELLESRYFDMAVLDIMGVDGFDLLIIANERKVMSVMLTAHALSLETTIRSFKEGAAYYVPKDEMDNMVTFLEDVLEAQKKGARPWWRWLERFAFYYDKKYGPDWKDRDKGFWEKFDYYV